MTRAKRTLTFDRNGTTGNVFSILARARRFMSKARAEEMCDRVYHCHSYDEALGIIGEYVTLVEAREERFV